MSMLILGIIFFIGGIDIILNGAIGGKMPGVIISIGNARYFVGGVCMLFGAYAIVQSIRSLLKK